MKSASTKENDQELEVPSQKGAKYQEGAFKQGSMMNNGQ